MPLQATWTVDGNSKVADTWEVTVPVTEGTLPVTLEAYDFQGNLIGSETINVTSSTSNSVVDSLRVTEINYNPIDPTIVQLESDPSLDNDQFEFIELQNVGSHALNLLGTRFTNGVDFVFPHVQLLPGERGVVVRDMGAFALRYGTGLNVLGEFTSGGLSNGGENLTLVDSQGQTILDFSYGDNDPWPARADGLGGTLEIFDAAETPVQEYGKYYHWLGSTDFNGSPGTTGSNLIGIVINEVLAHTDPPVEQSDSIELYNPTATAIDIGGWWISDSDRNLLKYQIPDSTILAAGQYFVLDEADFNPTPLTPGSNDFALSGTRGDDVWMVISDGSGGVQSFVDDVHFNASPNGESFARVPNGSGRLAPMQQTTLGTGNASVRVGPLVISELNYNPGAPSEAALAIDPTLTANDLEYVEIHNPTNSPVDLTNWQISGGVDYDFPAGTMIGAGETLVVLSFNPTNAGNADQLNAFRAHYGIDESVDLLGGYANRLNDSFEQLVLKRAGTPPADDPTLIPRLEEDAVLYDDLDPWPTAADGTGHSLQRISIADRGDQSSSWTAAAPTPGSVSSTLPGDFNGDSTVDETDIDLLLAALVAGGDDLHYDLDGSGSATMGDVTFLVLSLLATNFGDTDLDLDIDTGDLTTAIINFNGAGGTGKTWSQGDTDGDGDVDTGDLTRAIINFTGARVSRNLQFGDDADSSASIDHLAAAIAANPSEPVWSDQSNDRQAATSIGHPISDRSSPGQSLPAAVISRANRAARLHARHSPTYVESLDDVFARLVRE